MLANNTSNLRPIIGIDLDNTIICYEQSLIDTAHERGHIDASVSGLSKIQIRDLIRQQDNGEQHWQALQAYIYGSGIQHATAKPGVMSFLKQCQRHNITTYIVSHKTEFPASQQASCNLHTAARGWLEGNGFFDTAQTGLDSSKVFFEADRTQKIKRMTSLNCDIFIDDLIEVLDHPEFPKHIDKLLLSTQIDHVPPDIKAFTCWADIEHYIFS